MKEWLLEKVSKRVDEKIEELFREKEPDFKKAEQSYRKAEQSLADETKLFKEASKFLIETEQLYKEKQRKVGQVLMDSILFGVQQKFGDEAKNEISLIKQLDDIDLLCTIQKALWTTNSFNEFVKIYRA